MWIYSFFSHMLKFKQILILYFIHTFSFVKVSKAAKSKEQSGIYDRKLYQRWKLYFIFLTTVCS